MHHFPILNEINPGLNKNKNFHLSQNSSFLKNTADFLIKGSLAGLSKSQAKLCYKAIIQISSPSETSQAEGQV